MYFLFAWRYFKAKKSANAINIIAWISIVAIVIGTTALILVLSVFNGFEGLVKSLYSSFYTDLRISPKDGKTLSLSAAQLADLKKTGGVANVSLVVEEKAIVQQGDYQSVVYLKGVDETYRFISGVPSHLINGTYNLGSEAAPKLILGAGIEGALGIQADRNLLPLRIYLPRKSTTEQIDEMNDISSDTIQTSGAFIIQQDFDNKYALTNIDFVKRALRLPADAYTAVEISLRDPDQSKTIRDQLQKMMGSAYKVQDRYQQNQSLYAVMNLERWAIYGVLCLILIVAAFNMIGALTMLVLEKQKDISILHALGANRGFIQRIFLSEGFLLAIIGGVAGMLLAVLIVVLQIKFHLIPLTGGSFLIDYFPVELRWPDFLLVGATVFVIALVASWLPSRKAADRDFSLRSE
ncbi:FtsX-like permease family protein [Terrimonas ferruginea]|uniref:FtsX-like permease family protein n=1 Tax=Terrimonas ferruginea TaxID=249 RepID=UPI00041D8ABE|nr:FtsX-like permease family protein [Terrimonas ferruginea]